MLGVERESHGAAVCLRIDGSYDDSTGAELRRRLVEEDAPVVLLDFGGVVAFQDARLAMLVVLLVNRLHEHPECKIRVRGLRQHQERILGHLGVELGPRGEVTLRLS